MPDSDSSNKAADFDITSYLSIADNASLSATTVLSIGAWVRLSSKTTSYALLGKWDYIALNREYLLYYNQASNRFQFFVSSDGNTSANVLANNFGGPSNSTWYFVQAWYDGSNIYISVNNGTADSTAYSSNIFNGASPFLLGADGTAGVPAELFHGRLDSSYVAKSDLGSTVRTSLYNAGAGKRYCQLTPAEAALFDGASGGGYWNLGEGDGLTRNDSSNNANHLADNSNVTQADGVTSGVCYVAPGGGGLLMGVG